MKKILSIVLCFIMILGLTVCFGASAAKCEHRYGEWEVAQKATCVKVGLMTSKCEYCNDTKTKDIPKDPTVHENFKSFSAKNDGTHIAVCKDCNAEVVKNCAGTWVNDGNGKDTRVCIFCTAAQTLDCQLGNSVSCGDGNHKQVCSLCDREVITACTIKNETKVATCKEAGYSRDYCEICKYETKHTIARLAHIDTNADGLCDECGTKIETTPPADEPQEKTDDNGGSFIDQIKAFFQSIIDWFMSLFA